MENIPFNGLNSTEFDTFMKFDVIETENGANIKLTPRNYVFYFMHLITKLDSPV